jgi:hypothetical protein
LREILESWQIEYKYFFFKSILKHHTKDPKKFKNGEKTFIGIRTREEITPTTMRRLRRPLKNE